MVDGVAFKEFACCSWSHPAILAARLLRQHHLFDVEEIHEVRIQGFAETCSLGTAPPKTTEEAQFNTGWPLACYLLYGEVGPLQIQESALGDERAIQLLHRIRLQTSDELTRLAHMKWAGDPRGEYACRMEIELADGRIINTGLVALPMGYGTERDEAWIAEKFTRIASIVLPDKTTEDIISQVQSLDTDDSLDALIALVH